MDRPLSITTVYTTYVSQGYWGSRRERAIHGTHSHRQSKGEIPKAPTAKIASRNGLMKLKAESLTPFAGVSLSID